VYVAAYDIGACAETYCAPLVTVPVAQEGVLTAFAPA